MALTFEHALLPIVFAIVAALYASVGQAGGTGYIAIMGLAGFGPEAIKPTALALNVIVAAIGCARFARAGLLTWRSFYPFAILGAPFSVLGGISDLPHRLYQPVVGLLLIAASALMLRSAARAAEIDRTASATPPFGPSLLVGAVVGYVSGLTGVGGGIFLSPLVLAFGWVGTRQAAAVSVVFNLLNSAAALAAIWTVIPAMPEPLPWWMLAVAVGGLLGSGLGIQFLSPKSLRYILAGLLLAAGVRMIFT
ncbi:sulfite exporter TauE/SafE family protein [Hyphomicrobium sp.]|uniref:sulfite exporter TauE/SafE family protein n=1 Tax=Hyphomicrobium sp. TaxID=82 RepID=UPI000F9F6742|nr:sulfite exporter TauE/SafE family protein [Hyphomicrobium sp.]RUP08334.1 MAG: sulfite exporter TauE/SafE family protein [Hyphomicrobium sp.]